ncbi:MAG TPA: GNAT family N-acetyltransferase [candidate division Zixibacteria bacterium]|nr:GNAT family N-acetyltransferase [candidate division Zixibacteria bacterium]MDD4917978.1 GNAT family N-acetyltransferase [candidate division Zixibacteria bacterium]MDM7972470.1 GNAT family N-acetyltransferase [candidate division Zixibacteria bacterium]HOD66711.1 GNAT family N-acetyltransferase [candidate division Zixibacteria bacterium]HOZ06986.1 GNAT family N-acetyltransferase [candidate division Zixibacteria bacterium]
MKAICYHDDDMPEEPVRALTGDSFLASAAFASLWAVRGGRRAVWAAQAGEGIAGVLPGIEFGPAPIKRFMAMPNGLYGRVFAAEGSDPRKTGEVLLEAIAEAGYVKTYLFDFFGCFTSGTGPFAVALQTALLVDIGDPAWEPPDRKLRGEIRKAEREGLAVGRMVWATHGEGFLTLLRGKAHRRGGEARYGADFWQALAHAAQQDERVAWYYASFNNRPVASHIYFVEGDMLIGWQMYYDRKFSPLKANAYLIARACAEARDRGARTLDLGATPEGAGGTEFFKRRWGGREHIYPTLTLRRGIGRWL